MFGLDRLVGARRGRFVRSFGLGIDCKGLSSELLGDLA